MLLRKNTSDFEGRLAELEQELCNVKDDIRDAVRNGDEERLIRLRARADILPVKIANAKIDVAKAELSELENDHAIVEKEHKNAQKHLAKIETEFKQIEAKYEAIKKEYSEAGINARNTYNLQKSHKAIQEKQASIERMQQELEDHVAKCN